MNPNFDLSSVQFQDFKIETSGNRQMKYLYLIQMHPQNQLFSTLSSLRFPPHTYLKNYSKCLKHFDKKEPTEKG